MSREIVTFVYNPLVKRHGEDCCSLATAIVYGYSLKTREACPWPKLIQGV